MDDYLQKSRYFFKETVVLPDYVVLYRNEKIKWIEQLGLEGLIMRPEAIFGNKIFEIIEFGSGFYKVEIDSWYKFMSKTIKVFKLDSELRKIAVNNVRKTLFEFEKIVDSAIDEFNLTGKTNFDKLQRMFLLYSKVDTFSIFNNIIPKYYYNDLLSEVCTGSVYQVDDFLVSFIEPHRLIVRRKKLEIAIKYIEKGSLNYEMLDTYMKEYMPFDLFIEWLYDDIKLTNYKLIEKEIKSLANIYGYKGLKFEYEQLMLKRKKSIKTRFYAMNNLCISLKKNKFSEVDISNILQQFAFLSFVSTEEEKRHMIVCKFFIIIGRILRVLKLDIARSSIEDIQCLAKAIW